MLGFEQHFQALFRLMQLKEEQKRREKEQKNGKEDLHKIHPEDKPQGKAE